VQAGKGNVSRRAFITGITGQDGSYLAELLLSKGYEVWGLVRRSSSFNTGRLDSIYHDPHEKGNRLHLVYGDVLDYVSVADALRDASPHEVYNLAAQSHVAVSFGQPIYSADVAGLGALRVLEAVRRECDAHVRVYQASTSEMYGNSPPPQNETTAFQPRSPYACAKLMAHQAARTYREAYDMHVSCGILFNHESPRRGETFVTRKITRAATRIKVGLQKTLYLGNLHSYRDWGWAPDYVEAMWLMLQQQKPNDYVVATGTKRSVFDFLIDAFDAVGLNWQSHVITGERRYERPCEVDSLCGDASKARDILGWSPSVDYAGIVARMVDADLKLAEGERDVAAK